MDPLRPKSGAKVLANKSALRAEGAGDRRVSPPYLAPMHPTDEHKRLHWRAHHRGTREADMMIGGFFDAHGPAWGPQECAWYDALLEEQDVDIMAWAIGTQPVPDRFSGELMQAMQRLDYLPIIR
jgi:antitoxin CptB